MAVFSGDCQAVALFGGIVGSVELLVSMSLCPGCLWLVFVAVFLGVGYMIFTKVGFAFDFSKYVCVFFEGIEKKRHQPAPLSCGYLLGYSAVASGDGSV